jgi:hypothetical protein
MGRVHTMPLSGAIDIVLRDYLCVAPGQVVLVTLDDEGDRRLADGFLAACETIRAKPAVMIIPRLPFQGKLADSHIADALAAAAKACDVWIDLTFPYLAGSQLHADAMEAGRARYILLGDIGIAGLRRVFGTASLDRLFAVQQSLDMAVAGATGKTCRVRTGKGTDVRFAIAKPATKKPRHGNQPGTYTVPGSTVIYPEPDSVVGTIVVESAFHEFYGPIPEPMTLRVDGPIREVSGGGGHRRIMDRALRRAGNGEYGRVIHFSHGFHPQARFTGQSFIEDIRAVGSNAIGLGIPWWQPGGGENHPDAVITMQSLWVDDVQFIADGELIHPPALRDLETNLYREGPAA